MNISFCILWGVGGQEPKYKSQRESSAHDERVILRYSWTMKNGTSSSHIHSEIHSLNLWWSPLIKFMVKSTINMIRENSIFLYSENIFSCYEYLKI